MFFWSQDEQYAFCVAPFLERLQTYRSPSSTHFMPMMHSSCPYSTVTIIFFLIYTSSILFTCPNPKVTRSGRPSCPCSRPVSSPCSVQGPQEFPEQPPPQQDLASICWPPSSTILQGRRQEQHFQHWKRWFSPSPSISKRRVRQSRIQADCTIP